MGWCANGCVNGATFGRVRIRERTVSRRDIVQFRDWFSPVVVAGPVRSWLRRLREREMLSASSLRVGRCPSLWGS